MLSTVQHSARMEHYLSCMGLGSRDFERPHDIAGIGNKYDWSVIRGLASGYDRNSPAVQESLRIHRKQYHHKMWNNPWGGDEEDMLVGALDSVCSLMENRQYQGGSHHWGHIIRIAHKNPPERKKWMLNVISEIRKAPRPKVEGITSLDRIVLGGLSIPKEMQDRIHGRTYEAVRLLREQGRL